MIIISHRGNINGPNPRLENSPFYIKNAINKGYDCEIDVWMINDELLLGHDFGKYRINIEFLKKYKNKLWIHCKNIEALVYLKNDYNCFYHKDDLYTLTSKGYIWGNINTPYNKNVIIVNLDKININFQNVLGFCSDYV